MDSFNLQGKTALVTGAGVGIGRATALALAQAGAFVGIHFHSSEKEATDVLAAIHQNNPDAILHNRDGMLLRADLSQEDAANSVVDQLVGQTGRLDILVNNAGNIIQRARIEECSLEVWQKTMD